ncbi:MAG: hypothetical protein MKZ70_09745, partial [Opitutales bacterium]|nr:hypothetical protein [Opitutales bacterium]
TLGIPVHKLLGGSFRERIKLYISSNYVDLQRYDEALRTTATGRCIWIPTMIAHSYFTNRLNNQLVENVQRANAVSKCLDYR